MYYIASKETEDLVVKELRRFFADVPAYGSIFTKDFSVLGLPYQDDENGQKYFLISAGFPERFRFYPHVIVKASVQRFQKVDADNMVVQEDEINEYGRRTVKNFIKGGLIFLNLTFNVRALDQLEAEQIADLIAYWSLVDGRDNLKSLQAFIEPIQYPGGVQAENMKDSTDQTKIYRVNLSTTIQLQWLVRSDLDARTITKVTVQENSSDLI